MEGKEFTEYLSAEIEEIKRYVEKHPELTKYVAEKQWVDKYAADFSRNWNKNKN